MTLPHEEKRSLEYAGKFLRSLLIRAETPRVPKEVREMASRIYRHYPAKWKIETFYKEASK